MSNFKGHWLFLLVVTVVLVTLQYLPYIYHASQTPEDRVYLGAERYAPDYYIYLFYFNQGALGRTSVLNYYTNLPHDGSLVHIEYLVAGKIGSLLGLSLPATFYLFRTLTLVFYILVSFWFIGLFFKEENPPIIPAKAGIYTNNLGNHIVSRVRGNDNELLHKLTFLLSFFWSGIFWPETTPTGVNFKSYFDFYQPPDLINRLGFEPHKFLGTSLFLIIIYLLSSFWLIQNPSRKTSGVASLPRMTLLFFLALLAGLLHGVTAVSLIFTILFYLFFMFIISILNKKSVQSFLHQILLVFLIIIPLSLPLLYWQYVFTQNPVWQKVALWEKYFVQVDFKSPLWPTLTGYLLVLGPLIFLGLIGLKNFLKTSQKLGLLVFSFLTSNVFLFFLGYLILGTSKQRYFQTPYLAGWSILAMYGIKQINDKLRGPNNGKEINSREYSGTKKIEQTSSRTLILSVIIILLLGLPNFKQGLDRELSQFGQNPKVDIFAYPPRGWYQSLVWAKNQTSPAAVFLSLPNAGHLIPALPGRRVFLGDFFHTPDYYDKLTLVQNFYQQKLTPEEARNFLKEQNISYVFYGYEEKKQGDISSYASLLIPVFNNSEVTIYKIKY